MSFVDAVLVCHLLLMGMFAVTVKDYSNTRDSQIDVLLSHTGRLDRPDIVDQVKRDRNIPSYWTVPVVLLMVIDIVLIFVRSFARDWTEQLGYSPVNITVATIITVSCVVFAFWRKRKRSTKRPSLTLIQGEGDEEG